MRRVRLVDLLAVSRVWSAPLTWIPLLVGYYAAGGQGSPWLLLAAGLALHMHQYGLNTLADWLLGFDRESPYHDFVLKRVPGSERTVAAWLAALALASVPVLYLAFSSTPRAGLYMLLAVVAGLAYNLGGGHVLPAIYWLPAGLAYFFITLSGAAYAGEPWASLAAAALMFYHYAGQIAFLGGLKDIETPSDTQRATASPWLLAVHRVFEAALASELLDAPELLVIVVLVFPEFIAWQLYVHIVRAGSPLAPVARKKALKTSMLVEAAYLLCYLVAAAPSLPGIVYVPAFLAWVYAWNLVLWRSGVPGF